MGKVIELTQPKIMVANIEVYPQHPNQSTRQGYQDLGNFLEEYLDSTEYEIRNQRGNSSMGEYAIARNESGNNPIRVGVLSYRGPNLEIYTNHREHISELRVFSQNIVGDIKNCGIPYRVKFLREPRGKVISMFGD